MKENKTERIEHATVQEAIDYAVDRVLIGAETVVHLSSGMRQSVKFSSAEENTRCHPAADRGQPAGSLP